MIKNYSLDDVFIKSVVVIINEPLKIYVSLKVSELHPLSKAIWASQLKNLADL
jgi:hypothetical protein